MKLSLTPDAYKAEASEILKSTNAFVRVSRGEGLFVTDAPRREKNEEAVNLLLRKYKARIDGGLLYFTPVYGFGDEEMERKYTEILKSDGAQKEKLIRTGLSVAMRKKDQLQIEIYKALYEGMDKK